MKKQEAGDKKLTNYSVRMKDELIERCKVIADEESRATGYPVAVVAIMRKFIVEGIERYGEGKQ